MEDRIDITPDLYSRNYIISNIVEQYREKIGGGTLRILDIGGRNGKLEQFLPNDEITLIDIREGNEPNLIVGDATDMKDLFKDNVFDIVTSGDVFEHIPSNKREPFISECLRVSKELVIVAAPFNTPYVQQVENLAREYFQKYTGKEHEWLSEHKENGLPELDQLITSINSKGKHHQIFYSNNVDSWLVLLLASFASYWKGVEEDKVVRLYELYNKNLIQIENPNIPSYRKVVIIGSDKVDFKFKYEFDIAKKVNLLESCTSHITDIAQSIEILKEQHIKNLEKDKGTLVQAIEDFKNSVKKLNRAIEDQKIAISSERNYSQTLEQHIKDKDVHINNLESEIHNIKTSTTWKLFLLYKTVINIVKHPKRIATRFCKSLKAIGVKSTARNIIRKINPEFHKNVNSRCLTQQEQYNIWLSQNTLTENDIKQKKVALQDLNYKPLISIILPVYNVKEKWLERAIESVQNQIYENWELCINDDASTQKHIKPILKEYQKKDKRIKIKFSRKNQHISGSSNEALKLAGGEFIALMDNDDELTPNALFEIVKVLNEDPNLDFIYSDEDKFNKDGNRVEPFFKPDWSPDYFLSSMYTCHLGVYRKKIIDKIKGFRKGYEGAQDYDLVLRLTEKTDKIYHIPQILYHWRRINGSTSSEYSGKNYAKTAAKKALKSAIKRRKLGAEVMNGKTPESFRIKYKVKNDPLVSIIIPTWNKKDVLQTCIESIEKKTAYPNYELLIIDNKSNEPEAVKYLKTLSKKYRVIKYNKLFNFSAINNFAAKKAKGDLILFLNNDTEVISEEWLSAMVEHAQRENIGAVGAKLLYPNGQIQHAGVILGIGNYGIDGIAGHALKYMKGDQDNFSDLGIYKNRANMICNYSAVTAACLMTKKSILEEVGDFNEKELQIAFNDIDLCLRIRKHGYNIVYTPYAELYHHESISRGTEDNPRKQARFAKECKYMLNNWGEVLRKDSFYNPNLTKAHEDYSLNLQ